MSALLSRDVIATVIGTFKSSELLPHQVVLRHVVQDLSKDRVDAAMTTLEGAAKALQSKPLEELAKFIVHHKKNLEKVVRSDPWQEMVSTLNADQEKWQKDIIQADLKDLFQLYLRLGCDLERRQKLSEAPLTRTKSPPTINTSMQRSVESQQITHVASLAHGKVWERTRSQMPSSPPLDVVEARRINHKAAVLTFVLTLGLASFAWLFL